MALEAAHQTGLPEVRAVASAFGPERLHPSEHRRRREQFRSSLPSRNHRRRNRPFRNCSSRRSTS